MRPRGQLCAIVTAAACLLPAATLLDAKLLHMFDRHRSVIREQVQVLGPSLSPGATQVCVRLHEDEAVFNASFARFDGDPQIGLTTAKLLRLGQQAYLTHTYARDTMTCEFDGGEGLDFPFESVALLVSCDDPSTTSDLEAEVEAAHAACCRSQDMSHRCWQLPVQVHCCWKSDRCPELGTR